MPCSYRYEVRLALTRTLSRTLTLSLALTLALALAYGRVPVGVYEVSTAETVCACFLGTWTG